MNNARSTIIAGDFNAIIAKGNEDHPKLIGKFAKGTINDNGRYLVNFLTQNSFYATNTLFRHKLTNISTWESPYFPPASKKSISQSNRLYTSTCIMEEKK